MKQEDNIQGIGNQSQQSAGLAGQVTPQENQIDSEIDEPSVSLLDRAVAALILIFPFSKLIEWAQDKLHDILPQSIANMAVSCRNNPIPLGYRTTFQNNLLLQNEV